MRTKSIILSAIVGALSSVSLMAQVYSLNAVGYINVTLPPGFSMIANQLDTTNNNISPLLDAQMSTGTFDGCTIFKLNASGGYTIFNIDSRSTPPYDSSVDPTATTLNPGEGIFFQNTTGSAQTITFVGTVPQGYLSNNIPNGFSIQSSQVPQAGAVDSVLGMTGSAAGDSVFIFNPSTGGYEIYNYDPRSTPPWDGPAGLPLSPTVQVGQSFYYQNTSGLAEPWVVNFSVN